MYTQTKTFVNKLPNDRRIDRKGAHNAISSKPGVTKAAKIVGADLEHLKLFIANTMLKSAPHQRKNF